MGDVRGSKWVSASVERPVFCSSGEFCPLGKFCPLGEFCPLGAWRLALVAPGTTGETLGAETRQAHQSPSQSRSGLHPRKPSLPCSLSSTARERKGRKCSRPSPKLFCMPLTHSDCCTGAACILVSTNQVVDKAER